MAAVIVMVMLMHAVVLVPLDMVGYGGSSWRIGGGHIGRQGGMGGRGVVRTFMPL